MGRWPGWRSSQQSIRTRGFNCNCFSRGLVTRPSGDLHGFSRMTQECGVLSGPSLFTAGSTPHLHGDLDLLGGVQALGQVLQAVAAVGVGERVAAPAAPRHARVRVVSRFWHPEGRMWFREDGWGDLGHTCGGGRPARDGAAVSGGLCEPGPEQGGGAGEGVGRTTLRTILKTTNTLLRPCPCPSFVSLSHGHTRALSPPASLFGRPFPRGG